MVLLETENRKLLSEAKKWIVGKDTTCKKWLNWVTKIINESNETWT